MDEPDSAVSSQSDKPAEPPETVQIPIDPHETRPEPGSAETDGGPPETQNPSEPSSSTDAADTEGDQSQTEVQNSEVGSGPDPETRDGSPAGEEEIQLKPEESGENKVNRNEESEFEEITSFEARTTEHNDDPDSGPKEPAKKSRINPAGKV